MLITRLHIKIRTEVEKSDQSYFDLEMLDNR